MSTTRVVVYSSCASCENLRSECQSCTKICYNDFFVYVEVCDNVYCLLESGLLGVSRPSIHNLGLHRAVPITLEERIGGLGELSRWSWAAQLCWEGGALPCEGEEYPARDAHHHAGLPYPFIHSSIRPTGLLFGSFNTGE